jgi:hypothetical protein
LNKFWTFSAVRGKQGTSDTADPSVASKQPTADV